MAQIPYLFCKYGPLTIEVKNGRVGIHLRGNRFDALTIFPPEETVRLFCQKILAMDVPEPVKEASRRILDGLDGLPGGVFISREVPGERK